MTPTIPLILLSGMGADDRMFAGQQKEIAELRVPRWLPPFRDESLRQYARRMAEEITREVGDDQPLYIGGASFGGFLALEMLPYLNARGCFLVGAVRTPAELPFWIPLLRPAHKLTRVIPFQLFLWLSGFLGALFGAVLPRRISEFLWLGGSLDPNFFGWAAEAVLLWGQDGPPPTSSVLIYQIHGARDRILPAKNTTPDQLIPRGGHVIALSHPDVVTDFLRRHMNAPLAPSARRA